MDSPCQIKGTEHKESRAYQISTVTFGNGNHLRLGPYGLLLNRREQGPLQVSRAGVIGGNALVQVALFLLVGSESQEKMLEHRIWFQSSIHNCCTITSREFSNAFNSHLVLCSLRNKPMSVFGKVLPFLCRGRKTGMHRSRLLRFSFEDKGERFASSTPISPRKMSSQTLYRTAI